MQNKLFGAISLEEAAIAANEPLTVETVIAMEENAEEVAVEAEGIAQDIQMMDAALEVAGNIQTQVAVEEAVLASGNVTAGIAQLAAANLQANAVMLGMDPEQVKISAESIEQSPQTALKVSVEDAKETFKKIIDKIKQFFSKVWSSIKKLGGKIMLMVTDYEKKFKKLGEKLDGLSSDKKDGVKDTFSEKESKKIAGKFFRAMALDGGGLGKVVDGIQAAGSRDVVPTVKDYVSTDKGVSAVAKTAKAAKSELTNLSKHYDGIPSSIASDDTAAVVSRSDGTTYKAVTFKAEEVALRTGKMVKITCNYMTGAAKKDLLKKYSKDVKIPDTSAIKAIIDAGEVLGKDAKDFVKKVDSVLDETDKAVKDLKIDAQGSDKDKEADEKTIENTYKTMVGALSTNVLKYGSDSLLGYVAVMKNAAYLADVSMSKYKSKSDK